MNIYDVAKRAGVSTATVSRVLNGSGRVSQQTYEKVKKVLDEMNFTPNQLAISLATNVTKTVGVLLPDVRDTFHSAVSYLLEKELLANGYNCILCNTTADPAQKVQYLHTLSGKNVDGIIMVGSVYNDEDMVSAYKRLPRRIPTVLINSIGAPNTCSILSDEKYGINRALEHLKSRGRKHPIFFSDRMDCTMSVAVKQNAYISGLKRVYGAEAVPLSYSESSFSASLHAFLQHLMRHHPDTDAIICANDLCAAALLKAMQKNHISCPEQVAMVCFNNSFLTDLTTPSITALDQKIEQCCSLAVQHLLSTLAGEKPPALTYVKPELICKESS